MVRSNLSRLDQLGTIGARLGITRDRYRVTPGLYAQNGPGPDSPVLVTANYKLTFDILRSHLSRVDCWLLVVDTRGINVWCAAGKGTFSTEEIAYQVNRCQLAKIVNHRLLILPQLGGPGVASRQLSGLCGFKARYGPIQAADVPQFLRQNMTADPAMREITFTLKERAILIPVELTLLLKPLLIILLVGLLFAGIGPGLFSGERFLVRGPLFVLATIWGIAGGAILTPLLLPILPGRQFWLKGLWATLLPAIPLCLTGSLPREQPLFFVGLLLWSLTTGSYLAMNFTGSTPYTSLTGVERELKRGVLFQLIAGTLALIAYLASPFFSGP